MLFSVIVPIYNVEKYLKNCIDSVLNQSFSDFELILVDDGSPDNCPKICDEYLKKDNRIKVIHKENGGLVSARQRGISEAKGDYVFNLDGDDALNQGALEKAYEIINDTNADVVSFSFNYFKKGKTAEKSDDLVKEGFYNKEDIEKYIYPELICNKNMEHLFYFLWGKAIKRSILTDIQLGIDTKISLGEDLSVVVPLMLKAKSVYMSRFSAYLYTIRDDSISTTFKTGQITQIEDVIEGLKNIKLKKMPDFDMQISRYSAFMCFAILAAAAEGNHFSSAGKIKKLILNSVHKNEIKKAKFDKISLKSKIGIFLMKKNLILTAFCFLNICKQVKLILKRKDDNL